MTPVNGPQPIVTQYQQPGLTEQRQITSPYILAIVGLLAPAFLAYFIVAGDETQALAGVLGALGLLALVARPYIGMVLFIGLVYIRPEETWPIIATMRLLFIIAGLTVVSTWFHTFIKREHFARTPMNLMITGFMCAAVLSSV